MTVYRHCCLLLRLLLVALSTGSSFGILNITRTGCRGDSIQLFQNNKVDSGNTTLSLYKKNILTVVWYPLNSVQNTMFANEYSEKFVLDKSRNIWILDLQDLDEANYAIRYQTGNTTKKDEVKLDVLVEPETRCKPKIIRGVDTLTTYVEPDGCGKPAASAYWLEQPGIFVERNVIKLQPGQEAGTVYACIDGPALRCAKSSRFSEYCSVFIHENKIQSKLSEISGVTIATLVITILYDGSYILLIIILYQRLMHMLKKNANSRHFSERKLYKTERILNYLEGTELWDGDGKVEIVDEKLEQSTDETIPLLEEIKRANSTPPQISEESVPLLDEMVTANSTPPQISEDAVPLLDDIKSANSTSLQVSGALKVLDSSMYGCRIRQNYIISKEKTISQLEEKEATDSTPNQLSEKSSPRFEEKEAADSTHNQLSEDFTSIVVPKHETEEETTEHQPNTNSETMRELQELRHAVLCKICFANKMSMVLMPCNHIATCANCSISLQHCPVCRALIEEKKNIRFGSI